VPCSIFDFAMRILVTFAVEAEFAPWRKLRSFREKHLVPEHWSGGIQVFETEIAGRIIWVHLTGVGARLKKTHHLGLCAQAAETDFVISSGLAGSLKPEYQVGDVVVPRRIGTLRDANGLKAGSTLVRSAEEHGAKPIDVLLTADHIVSTSEEKNRLATFGEAVDMESHVIMSEAALQDIPAVTIRGISDKSDEDLPIDFSEVLSEEGQVKKVPLIKQLWRRPSKTPDLIRFGVRSRRAAFRLTQFIDSFLETLNDQVLCQEAAEAQTE